MCYITDFIQVAHCQPLKQTKGSIKLINQNRFTTGSICNYFIHIQSLQFTHRFTCVNQFWEAQDQHISMPSCNGRKTVGYIIGVLKTRSNILEWIRHDNMIKVESIGPLSFHFLFVSNEFGVAHWRSIERNLNNWKLTTCRTGSHCSQSLL